MSMTAARPVSPGLGKPHGPCLPSHSSSPVDWSYYLFRKRSGACVADFRSLPEGDAGSANTVCHCDASSRMRFSTFCRILPHVVLSASMMMPPVLDARTSRTITLRTGTSHSVSSHSENTDPTSLLFGCSSNGCAGAARPRPVLWLTGWSAKLQPGAGLECRSRDEHMVMKVWSCSSLSWFWTNGYLGRTTVLGGQLAVDSRRYRH